MGVPEMGEDRAFEADGAGRQQQSPWRIRTTPRPGDLGSIVALHGRLYAAEYDLNLTFEPYVARPLSDFMLDYAERGEAAGGLWLVDGDDPQRLFGSVAMLPSPADGDGVDQLRWFLLDPVTRGSGLGSTLISKAIDFSRRRGQSQVVLWTFDELFAAIKIYDRLGFEIVERKSAHVWGRERTELKMALDLAPNPTSSANRN